MIEQSADFDMCRSLTTRVDSINTIESEALKLAQSTNDTCFQAVEGRRRT